MTGRAWRVIVAGLGVAGLVAACSGRGDGGGTLNGKVIGLDDGRPVAGALVTLTSPKDFAGAGATTVFTDADGEFKMETAAASTGLGSQISVAKLGFEQVTAKEVQALSAVKSGEESLVLYLEPVADIASHAPASAWFANASSGDQKDITIASCSSCHQLASKKMRDYAIKIEAMRGGPDGDRKALEEWRSLVRHESWRTVVKYMRGKHYSVFPIESAMNLDAIDWPTTINSDLNFFSGRQGDIIAEYLAANFVLSADTLPRSAYDIGAPLGVTARTRIREYRLPTDALVREVVFAPGSPFLWGADVRRNMIVRIDPADGATKWYRVDFKGSTGPHTIVPDAQGRLWVSMVDNDQFGMFDPKTERWKLWTLRPTNLAKDASIAGAAIVHDMSIDDLGHLARDRMGRIWITLVGTNQMGTLNPDSGEITFNDANTVPGLSPINHLIYSTVLSSDGTCAWYSQVNGHVSCLDTRSMKPTKTVHFPEGTGPRRMARDNAGNLWVALFGTGQVAQIDMKAGRVIRTIDLPDRASAPYAVTWDERRKVIWVVTANSDAIYRISALTGKVSVYPLPRRMAYLRQLSVNHVTGQLAASYGNYPEGSGPSMAVLIDVGD